MIMYITQNWNIIYYLDENIARSPLSSCVTQNEHILLLQISLNSCTYLKINLYLFSNQMNLSFKK